LPQPERNSVHTIVAVKRDSNWYFTAFQNSRAQYIGSIVFLLVNAVRTDIALRRQGIGGIKGLYKSLTSFGKSNNSGSGFGHTPTKFYCMNCGYEHREYECPKCGSKAVKVG